MVKWSGQHLDWCSVDLWKEIAWDLQLVDLWVAHLAHLWMEIAWVVRLVVQ
jgi:hypothetical protein